MQDTAIVLISDPRVLAIPIEETNEPLVDVSSVPRVLVNEKRSGSFEHFTLVRQGVAERLELASRSLSDGVYFLFEEGLRPISVQEEIFSQYWRKLSEAHPNWNEEQIELETCKYVAPARGVPPHSTGAAIDISLANSSGEEFEMGSTSDEMPIDNEDRGFTYARNVPIEAQRNRANLVEVMTMAGFVNYPTEWWHWSYGDQYWAWNTGQSAALYGSVSGFDEHST